MLIVTHEVPFALKAADSVVLMEKGQIAESGAPGAVFTEPQSLLGAKYKDLIASYFTAGRAIAQKRPRQRAVDTGRHDLAVQTANTPGPPAPSERKNQPNREINPGMSA
jgi:ABC-type sulfate/molybdate transport systems ATPase subunit